MLILFATKRTQRAQRGIKGNLKLKTQNSKLSLLPAFGKVILYYEDTDPFDYFDVAPSAKLHSTGSW